MTKVEKQKNVHKFQISTKQSLKKDVTYQVEILFDGTLGSDSSSPFYQSTYSNTKHSQQKKSVILVFVRSWVQYFKFCLDGTSL